MASEEELFISVNLDSYRTNKLNILTNQADLLSTLKRLQNLKVMARRKNDLKKKIFRRLITIKNSIATIQKEIPTPHIPKNVKQLGEEIEEPKEVQEQVSRRIEIEDELVTIQEKLRELNG